ncbi:MAG: hypothetical protein ACI9C4_000792 [Paraglaciecola sp.]
MLLDGVVEMQYMVNNVVSTVLFNAGDIFYASQGTQHLACPLGEARILVVKSEGSI